MLNASFARRLLFQTAALLALAAPLLLIPDSSRLLGLAQFSLSGLAYLAVIAAISLRKPGSADPAAQADQPDKSAMHRYPKRAALALARALLGG
jgi:hypothetical protein